MKKVAQQSARVHWHMGQALLPEHFYLQEQSLREEEHLRFQMRGAPAWGLASLVLDEFQLRKGIISLQEMTLVLPTGVIVDIPGNTSPALLNMATVGATASPVYLHLQTAYDVVNAAQGGAGDNPVERIIQKVVLSTQPFSETAAASFKLAEVESTPEGRWSLRTTFVPPLLQVGTEPFTKPFIERLKAVQNALKQLLADEMQQNHLARDAQTVARACLRALFESQAWVIDVEAGGIRPHGFELFSTIRRLYIEVCMFREVYPALLDRPYVHGEFAECIDALLAELEQHVSIDRARLPYVEFGRRDGMFVCQLDKAARRAKDVYLLVQKPQVTTKLDLGRVKLSSLSRINTVHERALTGVPFVKLENPPFHHGLSSTVEFFTLSPGREWDYAVAEGNVVLFDTEQLRGARLYLYWREE